MKKIVRLLLIALCMSPMVKAQSYDDLYYNPKKDAVQGRKDTLPEKVIKKQRGVERHTYVTSDMPVVVRDRQGNARDIDEYNRRYDASENDFEVANDTLYVDEKENPEEGRWINGFNGTQDDYEYAQRIIRFRNPRFAVSVSSPYYWDIVYGLNSWDWNVYTDDYYAYAFPTFTNRLWSDWRFGSLGMGWGFGWNYPYYGGFYDGYYGYNSGYWGGFYGGWGYPYYGGYYGGWNQWYGGGYGGHWGGGHVGYYNNRRSDFGYSSSRGSSLNRRSSGYSRVGEDRTSSYSRRSGVGRVVGTRTNDSGVSRRLGNFRTESGNYVRPESSGRTGYTRPSSTRSYSNGGEGISRRSSSYSRSESGTPTRTYSRGSSATSRSYSGGSSSRRSYDNSSSSSSRSYSPSNSSSSRSSGSSGGNSGSSRSSGGSSGGGSSRSGGRR
ncbi:hypothetical protein [uncultured Bacteroides sp.]|uniref:hypothetical protein n=1 Tax=uncultured Bacteroides sp. TaxID=162156 RepID=UPI002AAB14B0|nr:hypothetical protein [uncultured Bacteroides sp.]